MSISDEEYLAVHAARELIDGEVCFVGIGVPSHAAVLGKLTHAPDLTLVYESGAIGALPNVPPLSTGSPSVADGSMMIADCVRVFGELQAGHMDVGLLSGAQVDQQGNLNSTVIGDYAQPESRLVGSGGAHDVAVLARRVVVVMPHDPRRFVEHVDFVTSPGLPGPGRTPHGKGPSCVVTSHARFAFEEGTLTLEAVRWDVDPDKLVAELGIPVPSAPRVRILPRPEKEVIEVLRRRVLGERVDRV